MQFKLPNPFEPRALPWSWGRRFQRRKRWPFPIIYEKKDHLPFFEISPLLLDLDAEDNPYVRRYDDSIDNPDFRVYDPRSNLADRVRKFNEAATKREELFMNVKKHRFSKWRISDYDIISTLLDPSLSDTLSYSKEYTYQEKGLERAQVIKWNAIPERMQDRAVTLIPYLLRRQRVIRRLHRDTCDSKLLNEALWEASMSLDPSKRFLFYQRIIEDLTQTFEGSKLISESSPVLGAMCEKISASVQPERLLSFLNNVVINLSSRKLPISPVLVRCAYQVSCDCRSLPMLQKYMGMLLNEEYRKEELEPGPRFFRALRAFQQIMKFPVDPGEDRTHLLLSIYGLLTGRLPGEDVSQPSFHDHISYYNRTQFTGYLSLLARLGAFRSMWYIWHTYPKVIIHKQASSDPSREVKTIPFPKDRAFNQAILTAAQVNSRFPEILRAPGFVVVSAGRDQNCEIELRTIITSASRLLADRFEANQHISLKTEISDQMMTEIFGNKSLKEAMSGLQVYLLNEILP
ncbi:hypothetical protein F5B19DRAFT_148307 [Rostrohypoxylon terebratum]|nr:hypothetical protein F5B19DRAFT_148307 [Rostrohypoxylon terebratum]